ncbi:MAG: hypothetical protein ABI140_02480 [Jatrophihabitantaceae bacterium]
MAELDRDLNHPGSQRTLRMALGGIGILVIGYGVLRLLTDAKDTKPSELVVWLVGSLLVHDAIIAPLVIGIGWLLSRYVPDRARAFVQAGLVTGGLISAIGVLLIWRQGKTSARSLALLQQNYLAHLLVLLAIVAAGTLGCYLIAVSRSNRTKARPPADQ